MFGKPQKPVEVTCMICKDLVSWKLFVKQCGMCIACFMCRFINQRANARLEETK